MRTNWIGRLGVALLCLAAIVLAKQNGFTQETQQLLITYCVTDGFDVLLPEYPAREKIARIADLDLEAGYPTQNEGATFWFIRNKQEIYKFTAKDLVSSSVWIAMDHDPSLDGTHDRAHVAVTYSDGGAIGGFHVRVFLIDGSGVR